MKGSWIIPTFVIVLTVGALIYFNSERGGDRRPLKELFGEENHNRPSEIEYEIVNSTQTNAAVQSTPTMVAVKETAAKVITNAATAVKGANPSADAVLKTKEKYFTIQLASSKDQAKAQAVLDKVKKDHADAYLVSKDLGDKGVWNRIYVGQYNSKQDADTALNSFKKDFPQAFIMSVAK